MEPVTETALLALTTAATIIFGPYLPKENIVCNNGTRWNCYCSVTTSSSPLDIITDNGKGVPRCVDVFKDVDVVSVDFHECKMKLNSMVTNDQTLENYLKTYLISWIKEECAMSTCHGFRGRDSDIQILFVLLACSNQDNTRLMINVVQKNFTNADGAYEQFPIATFARILTDRLHLLQYYFGSTVIDISVSRVPKYSDNVKPSIQEKNDVNDVHTDDSLPQQNKEHPAESTSPISPTSSKFNWTALIIGCVLSVYVCIVWLVACFLCHKQKTRRANKIIKREDTKNGSLTLTSDDSNQRLQVTSKLMDTEIENVSVYDNQQSS